MTNLIFITADQLRPDGMASYGNSAARTPALDRLAARGTRLCSHITPIQICSPSRATMFSGLYPRHHGLVHNGIALGEDRELVSHVLTRSGYRTHAVGKFHLQPILAPAELRMPDSNAFWELPESRNWTGPFFGFETADVLIGESSAATEGGHYARWLKETAPDAVPLYNREHALAPPPADLDEVWKCAIPDHLHYNSWMADRACSFLDGVGKQPFFLKLSFSDPHHPFSPPAPWCDLVDPASVALPRVVAGELARMPGYVSQDAFGDDGIDDGRKSYLEFLLSPGSPREQGFMIRTGGISEATMRLVIAHTLGMTAMIDNCVGRVLRKLDALGLTGDTIVVFTSDHGEFLGDHGLLHKGPPPYWQLLNVPLLIAGPGIRTQVCDALTSHVDLKATLMELLGVAGNPADGVSFAPLLSGAARSIRDTLFAEYHPRVVREQYNQSIISNDWRLTIYPERSGWGELFDRRSDRGEHHNLFHEAGYEQVRRELMTRLEKEWPPAANAGGKKIATY